MTIETTWPDLQAAMKPDRFDKLKSCYLESEGQLPVIDTAILKSVGLVLLESYPAEEQKAVDFLPDEIRISGEPAEPWQVAAGPHLEECFRECAAAYHREQAEQKKEVAAYYRKITGLESGNEAVQPQEGIPLDLVCLSDVKEEDQSFLISNCIPDSEITIICGDGGVGKGTALCDIVAAVTTGRKSDLFEHDLPDDWHRGQPGKVLMFSGEDHLAKTIVKRLKAAGADLAQIYSMRLSDRRLREDVKFGNDYVEQLISHYKPKLVTFDPIQCFLDPDLNMGSRNAMRNAVGWLAGCCERYKVTVIVVAHTNKRESCRSVRDKLSDSADLWDAARSVLFVGYDHETGERYISHEKSNYCMPADTVLFDIQGDKACFTGKTEKRYYDYQTERIRHGSVEQDTQEAISLISEFLGEGQKEVNELDGYLKGMGISARIVRAAKAEMKEDGTLKLNGYGFGPEKKWMAQLRNCTPAGQS